MGMYKNEKDIWNAEYKKKRRARPKEDKEPIPQTMGTNSKL